MIESITFVARGNTVDDPRHTFPIDIGYKGGCNNKSDKFCINDLNEISLPKNKFKFHCKNSNKCVTASMISIGIATNQIERRPFANHSGENSLFGSICGVSCNAKGIIDKFLQCETFQDMLNKKIDASNCIKCCNWNFLECS